MEHVPLFKFFHSFSLTPLTRTSILTNSNPNPTTLYAHCCSDESAAEDPEKASRGSQTAQQSTKRRSPGPHPQAGRTGALQYTCPRFSVVYLAPFGGVSEQSISLSACLSLCLCYLLSFSCFWGEVGRGLSRSLCASLAPPIVYFSFIFSSFFSLSCALRRAISMCVVLIA